MTNIHPTSLHVDTSSSTSTVSKIGYWNHGRHSVHCAGSLYFLRTVLCAQCSENYFVINTPIMTFKTTPLFETAIDL
eukprot:m.5353 g.5353  ORF g.5353 m.5353 type:complete len:77 (+) comp4212_c0_seq1:2720-2950(+)